MRQLTPSTHKKGSTKYKEIVSPATGSTVNDFYISNENNIAYNRVPGQLDKQILGRVTHVSSITVYSDYANLPNAMEYANDTRLLSLTNNALPIKIYKANNGTWQVQTGVQTDSFYVDDSTGLVYRATATSPYFAEVSDGGGVEEFDGTSFNPLTAGLESGIYRCTNLTALISIAEAGGEEIENEVYSGGILILDGAEGEWYYTYIEPSWGEYYGGSTDGETVWFQNAVCINSDVESFLTHHDETYYENVAINERLAKDMITKINANTTLANSKQNRVVSLNDVSVSASDWVSDSTQTGYSYKAFIEIKDVLATNRVFVTFSTADANSGNYCPVATAENGGIYIWSKTNTAITLDSIVVIPDQAIDTSVNWGWKFYQLSQTPDVSTSYAWAPSPTQSYLMSTAVWNSNMTTFNIKSITISSDGYILLNNADGLPLTIWVANSTVYTSLIGMFQQQGITIDTSHITQQSGWIYVKDEDSTNVTLYNTNFVMFWFQNGVSARWGQQSGFQNWLTSNAEAFYGVNIPEGVTRLWDYVSDLFGSAQLQYVSLPSTLTSINGQAFYANTLLKNVIFKSSSAPTGVSNSTFAFVTCKIYVPATSYTAYRTAYGSLSFANQLTAWSDSNGITNANDLTGVEKTANKVTSLSSSSTDTEYPSAKAVYDALSSAGGDVDLFAPIKNTVATGLHWEATTFTDAPSNFNAKYIWTDRIDIYYSDGTNNLVLNKATKTWSPVTWTGIANSDLIAQSASSVWQGVDGNTYCGIDGGHQYVLDRSTKTWSRVYFSFPSVVYNTNFKGVRIWSDGTYNYWTFKRITCRWDGTGTTWSLLSNDSSQPYSGYHVFSNGQNYYYVVSNTLYKLDKSTFTWSEIASSQWVTYIHSCYGRNVFARADFSNLNAYMLDNETETFVPTTLTYCPTSSFTGDEGARLWWSDGENVYASSGTEHYILKKDIVVETQIQYK